MRNGAGGRRGFRFIALRADRKSPILALITYDEITYDVMGDYERAYAEPQFECGTNRTEPLVQLYYSVTFSIFFLIPCVILMVLYVLISQHLIREPTTIGHHPQVLQVL